MALLLVFFILSPLLKSQEFAPVGAEWFYSEGFFTGFPIIEDYIKFTSEKDTMVKGISCRKITKRHSLTCHNRPDFELVYDNDDTVFFFDPYFDDFQVLYLKNAMPADSWIIKVVDEYEVVDTLSVVVNSVSELMVGSYALKKYHVTYNKPNGVEGNSYSSTIIDRIGDIHYMFNWYQWTSVACDANTSQGLRCYGDFEIGQYSTGIAETCDYIEYWVSNDYEIDEDELMIFPNPVKDLLEIKFGEVSAVAEIYDLQGKLLLSERIKPFGTIDLEFLTTGSYLISIKQGGKPLLTKRLVKK